MKKMLSLLLALVLVFTLAACDSGTAATSDGGQEPASTTPSTSSGGRQYLSMGTSTIGGTSYVVGGGLSQVFNEHIDGIDVSVEVTGGPQTNLQLIEQQDAELGLITAWLAGAVWNGEDFANGTPYRRHRVVAPLWCSYLYIVTLADSDINSLQDLNGKNIAGGSAGSSSDLCAQALMEHFGFEPRNYSALTADGQKDGLKDKTLDAIFVVNGSPSPTLMDLETTHELKFIQFTPEELAQIEADFPYWSLGTIPAGTHKHLDFDLDVVSLWQLLYVDQDLDDELVYEMTASIYDNLDTLVTVDKGLEGCSPEGINYANTPLHPGAYRYYEENGIQVGDDILPIE